LALIDAQRRAGKCCSDLVWQFYRLSLRLELVGTVSSRAGRGRVLYRGRYGVLRL